MDSGATLRMGTASGFALSILPNIYPEDILKTIVLAVLGASASFAMSLLLKLVTRKISRKREK